jgi:hypothetical protein
MSRYRIGAAVRVRYGSEESARWRLVPARVMAVFEYRDTPMYAVKIDVDAEVGEVFEVYPAPVVYPA